MGRTRFRLWPVAIAITLGGAAFARDSSVRLEYRAPAGCPTPDAFRAEVERRLVRARLASSAELARTYHVAIEVAPQRSVARLDLTDADGQRASRELSAPSCDEAARAIALVTALAIEARVAEEEAKESHVSAAPPAPPPPAPASPKTPLPPAPGGVPRRSGPPRHGLAAGFGVEHGFAPKTAARVSAAFELRLSEVATRAGFSFSSTGPVDVDGGSATFARYALRLEGCPFRLSFFEELALRPCLGVETGLVHAAGRRSERIVHPKSTTRPWLSGLALLRVELWPDAPLGLELGGGLGAPLIRHEFALEKPDVVVHEVPPVSWDAGLGLVGRF